MNLTKKKNIYFIALLIIWLGYVTLMVMAPPNPSNTLNLTRIQMVSIQLSVAIPLLIIWGIILYSILKVKTYADSVKGTSEEGWFKGIVGGLTMLFIGLILPSFISFLSSYNPGSEIMRADVKIVTTYVTVITTLLAFWFLVQSSKGFLTLINTKTSQLGAVVILIFIIIVYSYAVFNNPYRTISTDAAIRPTYYLSDTLILLTVMLPYIVAWFLGIVAMINFRTFSKNAPGLIYRKAFSFVSVGIVFIVGISIITQLITQFNAFFVGLPVSTLLAIVYVLIALILAGYVFVARGAKELLKIETV